MIIRKLLFLLSILVILTACVSSKGVLFDKVSMQRYYDSYLEGSSPDLNRIILTYMDEETNANLRLDALSYLVRSKDPRANQIVANKLNKPLELNIAELNIILNTIYKYPDPRWTKQMMKAYVALMNSHMRHQNTILEFIYENMGKDQIPNFLNVYQKSQEAYLSIDLSLSKTLGKFDDKAVVPLLIKIVNNPKADIKLRSTALQMLKNKNHPDIAKALTKLLSSPDEGLMIRDFTFNVLENHNDEKIMLALLEFLKNNKDKEYMMMQNVMELLEEYKDPNIIPTLHFIFENPTLREDLREQAFASLLEFSRDDVLFRLIHSVSKQDDYKYWPELSKAVAKSSNISLRQEMEILALEDHKDKLGEAK